MKNPRNSLQRCPGQGLMVVLGLTLAALVLAACPAAPALPAETAIPAPTQPPADAATPAPEPAPTTVPEVAPVALTPAVTVVDQDIANGTVTVAEVVSAGPGWIVIHAAAEGSPGPVLGYAAVADGTNEGVVVEIAADQASETLYAMLHADGGTLGTYEFPGVDGPVMVGDQMVSPAFQVTGGLAATEEPAGAAAAQVRTFVIVPDQTTAQYSIDETFINDNNRFATAIGKTSVVEGSLALNYADPAQSELGEVTVDISTLASDSGRRDNAIRERWLESARFPIASFRATEIRGFPAGPQEGQPIEFQLAGDMTIKETTREQVWDITATLDGDTLVGTATTFLMLADYNVPVPEILGIVSVTDGLTVTLDFTMVAQ